MIRRLLGRTFLSTRTTRLSFATFVASGALWVALPAQAANFNVATEGQLSSALSSAGNGDTITFTANITLSGVLPQVERSITINGGNFTLSGNNIQSGLFVKAGTVAINDLTIANARAQGGNGGTGKGAPHTPGGAGGGGGAGLGGALFVASGASVTVSNVTLRDNLARGGNGGGREVGFDLSATGGGGGGYARTGADGGNGGVAFSGGGGTGGGGDGITNGAGASGAFGGGGGGSGNARGGNGGFGGGGGGGGSSGSVGGTGGFRGGDGGLGGGGGGAGLGGAIFVETGGTLTLAGTGNISGNTAAGGDGATPGKSGSGAGSGIFLHGNGSLILAPAAGQTQTIGDAIADAFGNGGIGGSWALVKNAAGTTILTGANEYSGGTTVNSGVLQGNTASLQRNILNNAIVAFEQPGDGTYAGTMSGTGALTKSGAGTVALTGTNTFTGGTTINGGLVNFSSANNFGTGAIALNGGGLQWATGNTLDISSRLAALGAGGGTFHTNGNNVTLASAIGGPGQLVKSGSGELTLNGTNTYSGGTLVTGGTLLFTSDANLGAAGTGIFLKGGEIGTTRDAVAGLVMTRPLTLERGSTTNTIDVNLNPLTWAGNITGTGSLTKSGPGVLTLTGLTNTYSGGTQVTLGMLQVASDDKLGAAETRVVLAGGGLWATGTFTTVRWFELVDGGGPFQVSAGETLTLAGELSGLPGSGFTKVDRGTLVLAGSSNYGGNVFHNGGTIQGNSSTLQGDILFDTNSGNTIARSLTFDQAVDGTFAGNITGIGSLTKIGAGKLTLGGTNSYSTGTTVIAGTLQGTSRSLQGNITNNSALIFDQAFDGTYAGNMSGTGTLTKNGTGKLTLTGTSTVGGGSTINAGQLAVNGRLTSNVVVNKGGALSGAGNIKGDITNNGGTIIPGNSIGHMTIDGNFTFNGGTLGIEVNAQGDSDRISVVGAGHKVTINAGLLQIIPEAGVYVPNTKYTIITTEAGGTVWLGDVAGGVGFLTPQVSLDGGVISVSLALPAGAFRAAGQTANQQAVGGALDRTAAAGNVGGLVATMANLNPSQGGQALQALSGQPYADLGTTTIQSSQLFMGALGRQIAAARGAGPARGNSVALAEACDTACDASGLAPESRFAGWLSGLGATGGVAGNGNAGTLTYSMGGTAFGIDYRLDPRFVVGLAGGYVSGTQWVNGFSGTGYTDALSVAAYGSFTQGAFYADALAGYANAASRMQRIVAAPGLATGIANGSTSANQFLGQVETGWRFDLAAPARTSITPFAQLQVATANQSGFTESGNSAYNLTVAAQATTSVRTTFGADLAARFDLGKSTPLELGLRLGWMHEFADTARPMTAAFAGLTGSQFTVFGATPQRDSAVVGFAANSALDERTSIFLAYDGQVGGGTDNHALRAGFRLIW